MEKQNIYFFSLIYAAASSYASENKIPTQHWTSPEYEDLLMLKQLEEYEDKFMEFAWIISVIIYMYLQQIIYIGTFLFSWNITVAGMWVQKMILSEIPVGVYCKKPTECLF